jgi:PIN domain nuclease of toxin-antitoxin system
VKLLIDTQSWLWWFAAPDRLKQSTINLIADPDHELWFSVASVWEMGIKAAMAKLPLPKPTEEYIQDTVRELGANLLTINANHALTAAALPLHHRDPFDRILIAQAEIEQMTIVTADRVFERYSATIIRSDSW